MLGNIGPTMLILLAIVALLLFGPNKLPELGRAFGRTLREFKNGAKDMMSDEEEKNEKSRKELHASDVKHEDAPRLDELKLEKQGDRRRLPD